MGLPAPMDAIVEEVESAEAIERKESQVSQESHTAEE